MGVFSMLFHKKRNVKKPTEFDHKTVVEQASKDKKESHENKFDTGIKHTAIKRTTNGLGIYLSEAFGNMTISMHDKNGNPVSFTYTGHGVYYPNMSSTCGYGSDDWYFLCITNENPCILEFNVDGDCGLGGWRYLPISQEDFDRLKDDCESMSHVFGEYYGQYRSGDRLDMVYNVFGHLHPDDIESVKTLLERKNSRVGPITDNVVFGV